MWGCFIAIQILGLPLGANSKRIATWNPVIDRFEKKLALWKRKCINFGGRLTLVKSTLGSLPQFYMSMFKMPITVVKKLEKIQRQFLWGDTSDKKKLHLVGWDKITLNKQLGGLGIKKLQIQNLGLLSKWWWRFGTKKESLWARSVRAKHGIEESNWLPIRPSNITNFSHIWSDITSLIGKGSEVPGIISEGFFIRVASGQATTFWTDSWIGEMSLENLFPCLYRLSTQKSAKVCEVFNNSSLSWDLQFRRSLFQWEQGLVNILKQMLDEVAIQNLGEDQLN